MRPVWFALPVCVALSGPLAAQEEPPRPPVPGVQESLGRALAAARDSGALERRLVGTRWLHLTREGRDFEALVELRGELLPGGAGLACEMRIDGLRGRLAGTSLRERCELDFTGRVLRLSVEERRGERVALSAEGAIEDGAAVLQVQKDERPPAERREEWTPDALPFGFAAFFLPCLLDQGLPAQVGYRVFEGERLRLRRQPSMQTVAPEAEERDGRRLRRLTVEGRDGWSALVREDDGALVEVEIDGRKLVAIDAERAAALREAAAAPAPAPAPPSGE